MPVALLKSVRETQRRPGVALFEVLATRHLGNGTSRVVTQADVFQAFAATGLDYVGQVSTGHSDYGLKVAVDVGADLGALFAPGFVTLGVSGGVGGQGTKNLLLVLARQPTDIPASGTGEVALRSPRTCCFMALRGAAWEATAKVEATAGVKVGIGIDARNRTSHTIKSHDEIAAEKEADRVAAAARSTGEVIGDAALEAIGIGIKAEATASAHAGYAGTYMVLIDRHPTWHKGWMDADLRARFDEFVGVGKKAMVKARIQKLFTDVAAFWPDAPKLSILQSIGKAITGGQIEFARLEAGLEKAKAILQRASLLDQKQSKALLVRVQGRLAETTALLGRSYFSRRGDGDKAELKGDLTKLFQEDALTLYKPEPSSSTSNVKTERWKTSLESAESFLKMSAAPAQREALSAEVDHHLKTIRAFKEYDRTSGPADLLAAGDADVLYAGLCFLSMWGHGPDVGAEANAAVSATALTALSAQASAIASVSKSWKWTHYRFQQFMRSDEGATAKALPAIVATQDTSLRYTQTVLEASASAKATVGPELKAGAKRIYNSLSYESALVYWTHPVGPDAFGRAPEVTAMAGSGYALGQSVVLTNLCEQARGSTPEARAYLDTLAAALEVTPAQLDEFLAQTWVLDAAADLPTPAVLIEATFSVAGVSLGTEFQNGQKTRPALEKNMRRLVRENGKTASATNLESLRLRYRIADKTESRTPFKIGIPAGPVKIGITLEVVTRAGAHGVVDLDCYWFNAKATLNRTGGATARDTTVPPVVLFHQ